MGKIDILSHLGEGEYSVNIKLDVKTIQRVIASIESKISRIDNMINEIKSDIELAEQKIKEGGGYE